MSFGSLTFAVSRLRRRLAAERGSMLLEAIMASLLLGIVTVGVMSSIDTSARGSGNSRAKAIAGSIAQGELEKLRALNVTQLNTYGTVTTNPTVGGTAFTVKTTAAWASGKPVDFACTVSGTNTYVKLTSEVSWSGAKTPVKLESIASPGVRNLSRSVGALAIRILDVNGNGIQGVNFTLTATGQTTKSGTTNAQGCIVWAPVPAANWTLSGGAGYVQQDGTAGVTEDVLVAGQTVTTREYTLGVGMTIAGSFHSLRGGTGSELPSYPQKYIIANSHLSGGYKVVSIASNASTFTTPTLFQYPAESYRIYAGGCLNTSVPSTYYADVLANGNKTGVKVRLPAYNLRMGPVDSNENGASNRIEPSGDGTPTGQVKITTSCGSITYNRTTSGDNNSYMADPGVPYGTGNTLCLERDWFSTTYYPGTNSGSRLAFWLFFPYWVSWNYPDSPANGSGGATFNSTSDWTEWRYVQSPSGNSC